MFQHDVAEFAVLRGSDYTLFYEFQECQKTYDDFPLLPFSLAVLCSSSLLRKFTEG